MLGYLRFFLALLVASSHCAYFIGYFNQGVFAVVIFYILAGYVMTAKFLKYYSGKPRAISGFYLDRALRIFPQYLLWFTAGFFYFWLSGKLAPYWNGSLIGVFLYNLGIIPTSFWMIKSLPTFVGQAFSLGLELQFYLILPLFLLWRRFSWLTAFLTLLCTVFFAAMVAAAQPILDRFICSYYVLPGVLPCFVLGMLLFILKDQSWAAASSAVRWTFCLILSTIALCLILLVKNDLQAVDFGFEVCIGILAGTALLAFLTKFSFSSPTDSLAGHASYGIYLSHTFWIWQMDSVFSIKGNPQRSLTELSLVLLLAIVSGMAGHLLVEKPVDQYRKRLAKTFLKNNP